MPAPPDDAAPADDDGPRAVADDDLGPAALRSRRAMEAMWGLRTPSPRGPKQGLTLEAIAAVGIALADEGGLDAVSMRKVADRLGVGTMSLYTYVPGRAELVEAMLDAAYAGHDAPTDHPDGWRAALEAHARADWDLYERHPWVLDAASLRAVLGPHELDRYERALARVDGLGLTGREMAAVAGAVGAFVAGVARTVLDVRDEAGRSGLSDDEWWEARSPVLDRVWDAERWPVATRISTEDTFVVDGPAGYLENEARHDLEFGLQRLLDGIEALVARRRADGPDPAAGPGQA